MNLLIDFQKIAALGAALAIPAAAIQAATIDQTTIPTSTQGWNTASLWGGTAPTTGNDYRTLNTGDSAQTPFGAVNGTTWTSTGVIRDVSDASTASRAVSSTFGGDHLILKSSSRLLGKSTDNATQTVNLVMDGGFVSQGASNGSTTNAATLAGTITFGSSNIGLLGLQSGSGGFTWTINSTLIGGTGDTLQLTMGNATAGRTHILLFTGNLSAFSGTLFLGLGTTGSVSTSSYFRISSDALNAKIQLDTTGTNFRYNLGSSNVTFGSLAYGSGIGTFIGNGVYNAATLNSITGTSAFFGTGSITVVPEPSATAWSALALLGGIAALRYRRRCRGAA